MRAGRVFEVGVDSFVRVEIIGLKVNIECDQALSMDTLRKLTACSREVLVKLVKLVMASSDG